MSDALIMDVSSLEENSQTARSSSSKQCSEPLEQKTEMTENVQKGSEDARIVKSNSISVEQFTLGEKSTTNPSCEPLGDEPRGPAPEDVTISSSVKEMGLLAESATEKSSSTKQTTSQLSDGFNSESVISGALEQKQASPENVKEQPAETWTTEPDLVGLELVGPCPEDANINTSCEEMRPPSRDLTMNCSHLGLPSVYAAMDVNLEHFGPLSVDASKNPGLDQSGPTQEEAANNPGHSESVDNGTSVPLRKRISTSGSSIGNRRVLRSRSQEKSKAPETSNNVAAGGANGEKKRKKKKESMKKNPVNEFSRIRTHLRYLLNRMKYEHNFIDAYSGEGWKGQSLEKIKPEKELQRARSEIFRCKLKIRDLFQRIDLSCAEGKLAESLFDSEGQIDSEDIFCAKCGSADVTLDNDIILCDGACERAFHQFCLEPPLLKEDIPSDDDGWLCPGCDCKVDCIDLLNDSQGTNLSITESWEKVFPEAAAAGNNLDNGLGFPSDDSEDDDYNPDGPEIDEKVQSDESSCDESEYYSASDDLRDSQNNNQDLGLPSDDSEDDDYNPNGPDIDEQVKHESSNSDFTSDSEDFSVAFDDNVSPSQEQGPISSSSDHIKPSTGFNGEKSKLGQKKGQSLREELSFLLESAHAPTSQKRHVERLNYKKLHDETYGNVSSDSSGEEYVDASAPKKRKNNNGKVSPVSPSGKTLLVKSGVDAKDMKYDQKENENTSKRTPKKLDLKGKISSPGKPHEGSCEPGSSAKDATRSTGKRLGEAVTQRLYESFKENQYPDRAVKENLVKELGIKVQQVSKWFENARWSFRHSSRMESLRAEIATNNSIRSPQISEKLPVCEQKMITENAACDQSENKEIPKASPGVLESHGGDVRTGNLKIQKVSSKKFGTPNSRKREGKLDHESLDHIPSIEERTEQSVLESPGVDASTGNLEIKKGSPKKSGTPNSRKRKGKLDHESLDQIPNIEDRTEQSVQLSSSTLQPVRKSSRIQTRNGKSIA